MFSVAGGILIAIGVLALVVVLGVAYRLLFGQPAGPDNNWNR